MVIGEGFLKDLGRMAVWFVVRYIALVVPAPSELRMTKALGRLFCGIAKSKRTLVKANLSTVLGHGYDVDDLVTRIFENHFVDQYLIFSFPKIGPETINRYLVIEGRPYLDHALQRGKGVIIIHAHMGPRLLPLFSLGLSGYRMNQIEGPVAEGLSLFGRYCCRQKSALEKRIPAKIINGQHFLRPVFEALKGNEIVMVAGDGMGGGRFMGRQTEVDFFGYRFRFPEGPFVLASKTGASLVPLFTLKSEGNVPYRAVMYPPWVVPRGRLEEEELTRQVKKFVALLESVVRSYPCLWHFWDEFFDRTADSDVMPGGSNRKRFISHVDKHPLSETVMPKR